MSRPLAVIVSPAPGERGGGVEHHCGLVGDVLRARGWEVEEIGPRYVSTRIGGRLGLDPLLTSRATVRPLGSMPADLVVSNGTLGAFATTAIPRIHVYHGTMVEHVARGERHVARRAWMRRAAGEGMAEALAARGATTVAVAGSVAGEVRRWYRHRVDETIELCVDANAFGPRDRAEARRRLGLPQEARLALYVGRIEHRKGSDLLLPVCDAAGWELAVAGGSPPERGRHLGQLRHDELPWAYAAADAVLFPTRYEGFGFVSLEAVACERPLVTTATGWPVTLATALPGYAPFVVEPDVDQLTGALRCVAAGDGPPVAAAAAYVRTHHAAERFDERWAALIARVAPAAAARAAAD